MPKAHSLILLAFFLLALLPALASSQMERGELQAALDKLVAASTEGRSPEKYLNAVVLVDAPAQSFTFRGASGFARAQTAMTPDHQFYIESITKSFTATVALQLAEEGRLGPKGLDATLGDLEAFPPEVLDELHRIDGQSYGGRITVDQLVRHRTGMKNFTYDDEKGRVADYPDQPFAPNSLLGVLTGDPDRGLAGLMKCAQEQLPEGTDAAAHIADHGVPEGCDPDSYYFFSPPYEHWDYSAWKKDPSDRMAGLLNFYLAGMNRTALFPPGEAFAYTDTNYLVLGLVIEKVTGNSLHSEMRRRIFDPLKMERTYMSYATDPPAGDYRKEVSELWALNLPIVKLGINRSMMWSDAGIVSTVDDLNTFVRALGGGKLFKDDSTLEKMLTLPDGEKMGYGRGIGVDRRGDETILFHGGGAASLMIYQVQSGISFVAAMNDATPTGQERMGGIFGGFQEVLAAHGIHLKSPF